VYSGVHTEQQVAAGFSIGLVFGLVWFLLGHFVFSPLLFPKIAQMPLAKYFMIRDSTLTANVLHLEYLATQPKPKAKAN